MSSAEYEDPEEQTDAEIRERDLAIIRTAMRGLAIHFDSVQIFCTKHGGGCSESATDGDGNWWARFGQISEWVTKEKHRSRREVDGD